MKDIDHWKSVKFTEFCPDGTVLVFVNDIDSFTKKPIGSQTITQEEWFKNVNNWRSLSTFIYKMNGGG